MTEAEQRAAVIKEARSWLGTPFRDGGRVKGQRGGTDCGQFLSCVYQIAGVCDEILTPPYNMQFMLHQYDEFYIETMLKHSREISASEARPADIVMFKHGHIYSHGAILLEPWPGMVIHAENGTASRGVNLADCKRDGRMLATIRMQPNFPPRFFSPWGR